MNPVLQVIVEVLIWIEFGRVRGKIKDRYFVLLLFKPFSNIFTVAHLQVVQDEIHLSSGVFDETVHKVNESGGDHRVSIDHESDLSFIIDGGDHVDTLLFCRYPEDRFCSLRRIAAGTVGFVLNACLITPENLRLLLLCPFDYVRISGFQPLFHRFRFLLPGLLDRFLRSEAPPAQILAYGPDRHSYLVSSFDKFLYCFSCPQGEGEFELIGSLVNNEALNLTFLTLRKGPLLFVTASPYAWLDSLAATFLIALPYSACMVYADADSLCHRLIGKPLLPETNHLLSDLVLYFRTVCATSIFSMYRVYHITGYIAIYYCRGNMKPDRLKSVSQKTTKGLSTTLPSETQRKSII